MPIGFIASIGNFVQTLLWRFGRILIKHPQYLIPLIAIILFFPLELVDMFLYFIVNIFILLINIIILILLIFINVIWGVIASVINLLIDTFNDSVIKLICRFWHPISDTNYNNCRSTYNLSHISQSIIPDYSFDYIDINLFGSGGVIPFKCFFTLILGLFGITTTPLW